MIKTKIIFPSGESIVVDLNESVHFQKNFTIKEMANNLSKDNIKLVITPEVFIFSEMIQEMRDTFGLMDVNSWYRTKSFNDTLPGASKSSEHLEGLALDWNRPNLTNSERNLIAKYWKAICKSYGYAGQINYYTHGVHLGLGKKYSKFQIFDYRGKSGDW